MAPVTRTLVCRFGLRVVGLCALVGVAVVPPAWAELREKLPASETPATPREMDIASLVLDLYVVRGYLSTLTQQFDFMAKYPPLILEHLRMTTKPLDRMEKTLERLMADKTPVCLPAREGE